MSRQKRIQQGRKKTGDHRQWKPANEKAGRLTTFGSIPLAALAGQIWMTPGCWSFAPYVILAVAWAAFFAMSCVRDYAGGRFIATAAWLFIGCTAMLLPLQGDTGDICRFMLLLLIPAYVLLSIGSFIRHRKQGTLSLLPNSVFRR